MRRRAPLHGRCPLGLGTPLVESLSSFLTRLAMARHLATDDVIRHVIWPQLPPEVSGGARSAAWFLGSRSYAIDGLGAWLRAFVCAMERLTTLDGLASHPLLSWAPLLSREHPAALRRKWKRWCAR